MDKKLGISECLAVRTVSFIFVQAIIYQKIQEFQKNVCDVNMLGYYIIIMLCYT